jgi:hypothetical protein
MTVGIPMANRSTVRLTEASKRNGEKGEIRQGKTKYRPKGNKETMKESDFIRSLIEDRIESRMTDSGQ